MMNRTLIGAPGASHSDPVEAGRDGHDHDVVDVVVASAEDACRFARRASAAVSDSAFALSAVHAEIPVWPRLDASQTSALRRCVLQPRHHARRLTDDDVHDLSDRLAAVGEVVAVTTRSATWPR